MRFLFYCRVGSAHRLCFGNRDLMVGKFKATRIIKGVTISATITPLGGNQFQAVLTGAINPKSVQVQFIIGNAGGNLLPDPGLTALMAAQSMEELLNLDEVQ